MIPPNAGERIREEREKRSLGLADLTRMVRRYVAGFLTGDLEVIEKGMSRPTESEWSVICAVMPEVLAPAEARKGTDQ